MMMARVVTESEAALREAAAAAAAMMAMAMAVTAS
jgi:hypothetical protein